MGQKKLAVLTSDCIIKGFNGCLPGRQKSGRNNKVTDY